MILARASAPHVERTARQGQRLAVIPRARGDDAAATLVGRHLGHEVEATADLEGAGWIVVLVLDPRRPSHPLVEERVPQERRGPHVRVHARPRGQEIVMRWRDHHYHPSRQNTNTGKLTAAMMEEVFRTARRLTGVT
jgi:hypothetical protein